MVTAQEIQDFISMYRNADTETQKKVREALGMEDTEEKSDDSGYERN